MWPVGIHPEGVLRVPYILIREVIWVANLEKYIKGIIRLIP